MNVKGMSFMKAIIFDFDGTLANTLPICYFAFQNVFKEFDNKDLSPEEIKAMFGPSETGIIRENLTNVNKEQAIELYYKKYLENHSNLVSPNMEIDEMIRHLKENGIKIGIVTGKARRSLDISLKALQMDKLFEVIITGDDVVKPKPHPEGIIKALSLLGVQNNEAMFIGDSDADIQAGNQANVHTVGVQWLPDYQTLEFNTEPNSSFNSVKQLIDLVNNGIQNEL
jgi:phosphoglycolate phosphatase/pyrophosphatase PpaX